MTQAKYTGHANGVNAALQGHSVGEGYPWIIVGTSAGPDEQTYWYGLNAQSGARTGTFRDYRSAKEAAKAMDRYEAQLIAARASNPVHDDPVVFEHDAAPQAWLAKDWQNKPEEVRDQLAKRGDEATVTTEDIWFRDILSEHDHARRVLWARYWLLGRWEDARKSTVQHWVNVAQMLRRRGNGLQHGEFTKEVQRTFAPGWARERIIRNLRGD